MKELLAFAAMIFGIGVVATYVMVPQGVDALIDDLNDPDPAARRAAARAIGRKGESGKEAISHLQAALEDSDFAVRVVAGVALTRLGVTGGDVPISPQDGPALVAALSDRDHHVRDSAVEGLKQIGSLAVPALIKGLESDETRARWSIVTTLSSIGPQAADAVPALTRLVTVEKEPGLRWSAIHALGAIGPAAQTAVPMLVKLLQSDDESDRRHAVNALGDIGPAASTAITALENARSDHDTIVSRNAELALKRIRMPRNER